MATARRPAPPADVPPAALTQPDFEQERDMKEVYGPLGYLKELFKRFGADQCGSWAASLSFFSILSIAPILLCGLAVLGFLIRDPNEASARVQDIIANVLPGSSATAHKQAASLVEQMNIEKSAETLMASRGIAGIIGILSLFWAAMQIFVNAVPPVNAAFRAKETRGFVKLRTSALALLFGAGALFLLSLLPTSGAQILGRIVTLPDPIPPILAFFFLLLSVAVNAVMYTVIYRFLPSPAAKVTWRAAAVAGVIVAILWEAAKQGFGFYLAHFANYNKMYGSLGGLVALIFWIYYSSMLLLLGAEIAGLYLDAKAQKARDAASKHAHAA
jgi:membrane protein